MNTNVTGVVSAIALLMLVILLLVLVALAVAVALLRLREAMEESRARVNSDSDSRSQLRQRLLWVMWWLATVLSAGAFIMLIVTACAYFASLANDAIDSYKFEHLAIHEEYIPMAIGPKLIFSTQDEVNVGGNAPQPGEVFLISAALKDERRVRATCTQEFVQHLVRSTGLSLRGVLMTVSPPSVDAGWLTSAGGTSGVCAVRWTWAVTLTTSGKIAAVVSLVYRDGKTTIYRAKSLHYAALTLRDYQPLYAFLTSVAVALLSLAGVLVSAWLSSRNTKHTH